MSQTHAPRSPRALLLGLVMGLTIGCPARGDDDPDALRPGILLRFEAAAAPNVVARRVVPDLREDWGEAAPDPRLPVDGFQARAEARLLVQAAGAYRFFARTDGAVLLRLADRVVLDGKPGAAVELRPGFVPLVLEYQHVRGRAHVAIDWEGPGFAREPLPARLLFHDPERGARDPFETGRRLADRLGCANCHRVLDLPRHPGLGPALSGIARAVEPGWLERWLRDPTAERPGTTMPRFGPGLTAEQASDLAAFLSASGAARSAVSGELRMALNVASPERGRALFQTRGCLACHARGAPGEDAEPGRELPAGPDLTDLGRKWSRPAVAALLEHPRSSKAPSRHRPDLSLTADDAGNLAAFLVPEAARSSAAEPPLTGDRTRGRALAERLRCAGCHAIDGLKSNAPDWPLRAGARAEAGCLAEQPTRPDVPWFHLTAEQRAALRAFVAGLPAAPAPLSADARAHDAIARRNCLGCHIRDGRGAEVYSGRITARLTRDPALAGFKGMLTPPNLTAVGDKLQPAYLAQAIRGDTPVARPWLSVRMPRFDFEPGEADAIATAWRNHDRMNVSETPDVTSAHDARATKEQATALIGQRGFGCVSCHVIAGRIPPGGEAETLGPDLALAHRRLSERYFRRWISDPQRIIAGTPMPQFLKPIAGAGLPVALDDQLAAIWNLLAQPDLAQVTATGTREVLQRDGDRALVVRDMMLLPGAPGTEYTPRGIAMGFANGTSLLFDADRLTWLAWWHDGFAYRTKSGRLWEWHPEGERLWTAPARLAPVAWRGPDGRIEPPDEVRERFGSFRALEFVGQGVRLRYRLNRRGGDAIAVTEFLRPIAQGWERVIRIEAGPDAPSPVLVESLPPDARLRAPAPEIEWTAGKSVVTLQMAGVEARADGNSGLPGMRTWPIRKGRDGAFEARQRVTVRPVR